METVVTSMRDQKKSELGFRLIKAMQDKYYNRITDVELSHTIEKMNEEGKITAGIDPNEILSNAMANRTVYISQLVSQHPDIPYA